MNNKNNSHLLDFSFANLGVFSKYLMPERDANTKNKTVFLLTDGDGSDGDEWQVIGIYSTRELAEQAKRAYETPQMNIFGKPYIMVADIEEWEIDSRLLDEIR
jgi:hypothetical protein